MYVAFGKRVLDIFISLIILLVLTPLFIVVILVIYLSDGPPIFFYQTRIGKQGEKFDLIKFRSMKNNAEDYGTTTFENDPRVIVGGSILRKFKIDELPQLLNVLKGEMSIVGPRPTVESDFKRMSNEQRKRANVLPGLTGLAQISGNTSLTWPERIEYDLSYIQSVSLKGDLIIILKTFFKVLSNKIDSNPPSKGEW